MISIKEAASDFLSHKRIAVTGVSRHPESHGGNLVYKQLREHGYTVFAVNPSTDQVEGDRSYPDLKSIPGGVDAVVIATRPSYAGATMQECVDLGIRYVWMHQIFKAGSVSHEAADEGRRHGISVIEGGCPLMFDPVIAPGHKFLRRWGTMTGRVPRQV